MVIGAILVPDPRPAARRKDAFLPPDPAGGADLTAMDGSAEEGAPAGPAVQKSGNQRAAFVRPLARRKETELYGRSYTATVSCRVMPATRHANLIRPQRVARRP
jgi:hypothetical protein